jgi:hypothetical protein
MFAPIAFATRLLIWSVANYVRAVGPREAHSAGCPAFDG